MSCYHRYWHACDWPPPPDWYDPYAYASRPRRYPDEVVVVRDEDELEGELPRRRRGSGRGRRYRSERADADEVTPASLQARAEALRAELERIEADLRRITATASGEPET